MSGKVAFAWRVWLIIDHRGIEFGEGNDAEAAYADLQRKLSERATEARAVLDILAEREAS